MSRKHYEAIAEALREEHQEAIDHGQRFTIALVAVRLADVFEENPRFDRARFLAAALPQDGES